MNKINLCDSCMRDVPTCKGDDLLFGSGVGNDNVISCNSYLPFVTKALTKTVYVATVNSDLTEGKGHSVVYGTTEIKTTAIRIGKSQNTMGSNAYIEKSIAVKVDGHWLARTKIIQPSKEDKKADKVAFDKEVAIKKAKHLGLTDEDINNISSI